ncbi:MAG: TonB-dependent receptor plug domain-containing protein [Candidatus Binatia bacterium]|nr:TonB-dependent receptor plug domain-containing protein [Candidatus Binatia bacterium]
MPNKLVAALRALPLSAVLPVLGFAQEGPAAEAADDTAPGLSGRATAQVEESVVQARKRAELLEDTPVAVTALSESTLREANVTQIDQIQELVPNLTFVVGGSGQEQQLLIRGIGTATLGADFEPGVGFYIDGVFLPRAQGGILDVVDVQQVEVLRGAQGTLLGKNNIRGAVNITSIKPHEELEAFAMVRPGNLGTVDARIMFNLPIDASVALWDRNLTGPKYTTFVAPLASLFGHVVRYHGAPRTFGAELSYRFGG